MAARGALPPPDQIARSVSRSASIEPESSSAPRSLEQLLTILGPTPAPVHPALLSWLAAASTRAARVEARAQSRHPGRDDLRAGRPALRPRDRHRRPQPAAALRCSGILDALDNPLTSPARSTVS
jgi:hypothetical protein